MKWAFLEEVGFSWRSGFFLLKFPIRQKRGTCSSCTWEDVEYVAENRNSSKTGNFIKKRRFLMKWAIFDEVGFSW